ncbi:hypothetical protein VNO77_15283 [Canavalia gladiata]|uniref:Uncharacterized protein n=1 Tax=Canavalia gladiata TaxID=3824 RepID=A0AAN9QVS6_CANGL
MQVTATRATLISTLRLLNKLKPTGRRLKAICICTLRVCYQTKGPLHSSANGVDIKNAPSWSPHKPCSMQKRLIYQSHLEDWYMIIKLSGKVMTTNSNNTIPGPNLDFAIYKDRSGSR